MKTVTVCDLSTQWPKIAAALKVEQELIVTHADKPVARLVHFEASPVEHTRFDPKAHAAWQKEMCEGKIVRWVDEALNAERNDR